MPQQPEHPVRLYGDDAPTIPWSLDPQSDNGLFQDDFDFDTLESLEYDPDAVAESFDGNQPFPNATIPRQKHGQTSLFPTTNRFGKGTGVEKAVRDVLMLEKHMYVDGPDDFVQLPPTRSHLPGRHAIGKPSRGGYKVSPLRGQE